jgi:hypothetical protein
MRSDLGVRCGAALALFALTACGRLGYQVVDDQELTTTADATADTNRVGSGGAIGTGSPAFDASEAQGGAGGAPLDAPVGATDASSDMSNGSDDSSSTDGPSSADAPATDAQDAAPNAASDAPDAASDARDATADATTAAMTVDDSVQGVGFNQFDYVGSGWLHCTACIIGATYYDMSDSWSNVTGDVVTLTFTGTQLKFYGVLDTLHGIGAASIDGGPETTIDFYSNMILGNQLLWTSPLLPAGIHTFALRVTGQKNRKSSDFFVTVDRVDVQ